MVAKRINRTAYLQLRVTPAEKAALMRAGRRYGGFSHWARAVLAAAIEEVDSEILDSLPQYRSKTWTA
jgi:hypothetical protein